MTYHAILVLGSITDEDKYGVASGNRVAAALRHHGWRIDILHARDGRQLLNTLLQASPDLVIPVGFGAPCEDGHVFAAARLAGVPCAGPTPAAGSLMQDKSLLSRMVDAIFIDRDDVRSPRGCVISGSLPLTEVICHIKTLTPPLVVKPSFSGSSEGLEVAQSHEEAAALVASMLMHEGKILVQQLEHPVACEVSCTVLDEPEGPIFLPIVELRRDDVQVLGPEQKFGEEGLDRHIIPVRLPPDMVAKVETVIMTLRQAIGPCGLTRTDLLVLPNGDLVILEVNGIPGLLESSIACDAAKAAGISFNDLALKYALSAFLRRSEPQHWVLQPRSFVE